MNIRGLTKFSLVDYPGKLACVVFVGNCNFRCPFCHNPYLVLDPESQPLIAEDDFLEFLQARRGKLEGVVISGGEPSLRKQLRAFAKKIKSMGFLVKLDTNGTNHKTVRELHDIGALDHLGVDYKAPSYRYAEVTGIERKDLVACVQATIGFALKARIPLDVRTTVHKSILSIEDLFDIREELDLIGIKDWTIQQFHPVELIDNGLLSIQSYSDMELLSISRRMSNTKVRGLKGVFIEEIA